MIFRSTPKCPNCGKNIGKDSAFCNWCGHSLGGALIRCGKCGTENRADATFCAQCGQRMDQNAAASVYRHHWARDEQDFAVRIDSADLKGMLVRGLIIEPGTNAMLIERGQNRGMIPPGEYTLENILKKGWDWLTTGVPEQANVLLVDVTTSEMEFHLGGRLTQDALPTGISLRMQVEVRDPGKFLVNMLKGRQRYTLEDLRQYLYPEIAQVADDWLRSHTLQEIVENPRSREEIALAIEESLRKTFAQSGLAFLQLRTAALNLEPYDRIKEKRSKNSLLIEEYQVDEEGKLSLEEAKIKARKRWLDLQEEVNLANLAEEEQKVNQEEHKAELYQRMRQAVMGDRMDEVRSETDFDKFLDEIDYEKLLRKKEREDLLRTWREQAEDGERARAHLLARTEVEQAYALRMLELKSQGDLTTAQLDQEIALNRKRAEYEFEIRRRQAEEELELERQRIRIQQERDQAEMERMKARLDLKHLESQQEREDDEADAMVGLRILAEMRALRRKDEELRMQIARLDEEERRRISREDDLKRAWELHKIDIEKRIQSERERAAERGHELLRMEAMRDMPAEALIALSTPTQAAILADLKQLEAYRDMDADQILVLSAKGDPGLALALQEKFKAGQEGQSSQAQHELYERLLQERMDDMLRQQAQSDRHARDLTDAYERSAQRNKETSEHAMDRLADTAKAFATGKDGQPIIVVPGGASPQVIQPGQPQYASETQPYKTKNCPVCAMPVEIDAKFCKYCGNKFQGME